VDAADLIWHRAAIESGGTSPGPGDVALADALAFHGLAMSGGMLDAVERASAEDLANAGAGFRWLGLESVAVASRLAADLGLRAHSALMFRSSSARAGARPLSTAVCPRFSAWRNRCP
jgi:hypothetical protein